MIAMAESTKEKCKRILGAFFRRFPNKDIEEMAFGALPALLVVRGSLSGKLEGWMAGLVYAVSSIGVGVPGVLNSELEHAFHVSMSTVYKRAAMIRRALHL